MELVRKIVSLTAMFVVLLHSSIAHAHGHFDHPSNIHGGHESSQLDQYFDFLAHGFESAHSENHLEEFNQLTDSKVKTVTHILFAAILFELRSFENETKETVHSVGSSDNLQALCHCSSFSFRGPPAIS